MKIVDDLLKTLKGKWSRKSVLMFVAFFTALLYETILPILGVQTKEYVFVTLISFTAGLAGLTVWDKKKQNANEAE